MDSRALVCRSDGGGGGVGCCYSVPPPPLVDYAAIPLKLLIGGQILHVACLSY